MKVLSGYLKGMELKTPPKIRVTSSTVKKSVMDTIGSDIYNKIFLDLCAGSGNVGIEAISRGARKAIFVEIDKQCIDFIKWNCGKLKVIDRSLIFKEDIIMFLKDNIVLKELYEDVIIYLDPPYDKDYLIKEFLDIFDKGKVGINFAMIIIETTKYFNLGKLNTLRNYSIKNYGESKILFLVHIRQV